MPEQELSIREREQQLFDEVQDPASAGPPVKPFPIYLRETPANPIASEVKVILWIVGIVVFLLLAAALWRIHRPSHPRQTSGAAKTAMLRVAPPVRGQGRGCKGQFGGSFTDCVWKLA